MSYITVTRLVRLRVNLSEFIIVQVFTQASLPIKVLSPSADHLVSRKVTCSLPDGAMDIKDLQRHSVSQPQLMVSYLILDILEFRHFIECNYKTLVNSIFMTLLLEHQISPTNSLLEGALNCHLRCSLNWGVDFKIQ